jgi:hypothetical protein
MEFFNSDVIFGLPRLKLKETTIQSRKYCKNLNSRFPPFSQIKRGNSARPILDMLLSELFEHFSAKNISVAQMPGQNLIFTRLLRMRKKKEQNSF